MKNFIRHRVKNIINKLNNRFDPYNYYEKNILNSYYANTHVPTGNGDDSQNNILITVIVGAYGHTFEGLYARKAALSGKNVHVLMCNGAVSKCDIIGCDLKHKRLRCEKCIAQQEDFVRAFGCIHHMLLKPDSNQQAEINDFIAAFFKSGVDETHSFHGVIIDRILYSALQKYYFMSAPEIADDKVTRDYLYNIAVTILTMEELCNEIKPKYVLTSHGTYSIWGAVLEFCKCHKIYVITHGVTYNHNGIGFKYNDSCITSVLDDEQDNWSKYQLSDKENSLVKHFLDERAGKIIDDEVAFDYNKNNKRTFSRAQIIEMLKIDPDKKIVGLFPNIPWDGDMCSGAVVFQNSKEWLKKTIEFFNNKVDTVLVIRPHPAEALTGTNAGRETVKSLLHEMFCRLPSNIVLLEADSPINSYSLGESCVFGISYASTIALELLYMGIPMIIAGCPQYKDKNVGFDIASIYDYYNLIDKGIDGKLLVDSERRTRLFQFVFYFYFKKVMPQTLLRSIDAEPIGFKFANEKELNEDPAFEELYRCVENNYNMDFSPFYK